MKDYYADAMDKISCLSKYGEVSSKTERRGARYIDSYAKNGDPGDKIGATSGYEGTGAAVEAGLGAILPKLGDCVSAVRPHEGRGYREHRNSGNEMSRCLAKNVGHSADGGTVEERTAAVDHVAKALDGSDLVVVSSTIRVGAIIHKVAKSLKTCLG